MKKSSHKAIAIVGVSAIMPDALDLPTFWNNIKKGTYSISDVDKDRWDPAYYYDPDPKAPDKTYSRIGGWVRKWNWDPLGWRLPIPPKVSAQMDLTQIWAISASREALQDFGYPDKQFDPDRTAVILGNAMGGDRHLYSSARILFPEYEKLLVSSNLSEKVRQEVIREMRGQLDNHFLPITEDTMPGELSNIVAGRIAALYNFHGPNYVTDAACASAMAAMNAAIEGLEEYDYDTVVTGGIDANMSPTAFVKFSKIGALSNTGTRPYAKGADGFVMGEGAALFILKRLEDAERDQDKIYAVIRGFGGSSDGKGKGITAPNPVGQKFAVKRAWENAGLSPATVSMVEGHGTSTSVGDAVELQCLHEVFGSYVSKPGSIALGSVKSNIGHLKGAAGAAGILKATMALYEKVLPPSLNFNEPNPNVDFNTSPFYVNTELRPWELKGQDIRRCGVSAFGFGGTNFHAVLEEYIPGRIKHETTTQVSMHVENTGKEEQVSLKKPLRGAFVKGASSKEELLNGLEAVLPKIQGGYCPEFDVPDEKDIKAPHRLAIDYGDATELATKMEKAIKALNADKPGGWRVLNAKGTFYGTGSPGKVAFLFTGQGSQYVNMLDGLRKAEPIVADIVAQADKVMKPLLGKPITEYIYVDKDDAPKMAEAVEQLKQTEITQPAVLTVDTSLSRLMKAYGIKPDMVMGHSLGEYGALVCADVITFEEAMEAVSARGHQMAKVQVEDKGKMAAVFGSYQKIGELLKQVDGYVEIANINSNGQSVIGGATQPVMDAMKLCKEARFHVAELPVSHAFHTQIVAPASEPLKEMLNTLNIQDPSIPVIANVTGDFYPRGKGVKSEIVDILSKQVASPVQFVKGVERLYEEGARVFVEMGPKKALNGFVKDVLSDKKDIFNLFTNQQKVADVESFNQALCGMYAAGHGNVRTASEVPVAKESSAPPAPVASKPLSTEKSSPKMSYPAPPTAGDGKYEKLGRLFVDFMDRAQDVYQSGATPVKTREVWITGAALGLPGVDGVFQDSNVARILNGDQFIKSIPMDIQQASLDKNIVRLVKTGKGGPRFESINQLKDVIKLAGQSLNLDLVRDFDFPEDRIAALEIVTKLAIGSGIDALRDAGIPLTMRYKTTSTGSKLPDRWMLPETLRDDTGIIFASAFPGLNAYAKEITLFHEDQTRKKQLELLVDIKQKLIAAGNTSLIKQLEDQIVALEKERAENPYVFNRRFLLRVLAMGHSQFAEYIGARGPNIQVNVACASGTTSVGLAKNWIEAGKCRRVIIISADDITGKDSMGWFAPGFLASGVAATDARIEDAALPFDRRRHGMIVGMGAAAVVVESGESARERGLSPICEVLGTISANSAFHATRLDIEHIKGVMEEMIQQAEKEWGIDRHEIAEKTVFISHETYTPARGGSASAEIHALRHVFKESADKIVIANTKGYTGHAMATGIEDVLGIKSLETAIVPPVANFKEVDPELGMVHLSKGGSYPVTYALRLGAGFGSQISMSLMRWVPTADGRHRKPEELGYQYRISDPEKWNNWLNAISNKTSASLEVHKRTLRIAEPDLDPQFYSPNGNGKETTIQPVKEEVVKQPMPAPVQKEPVVVESAVQSAILELIAEKTGYPPDMLDIDLDLEADLGVDTVKQAELFADIREQYGIERDDTVLLSDFPTLRHIIQFVYDKKPELKEHVQAAATAPAAPAMETPVAQPAAPAGDGVQETILQLIAEKTGYPPDMLDPELDLEADLGIDTVKQAELFAEVRDAYGIERDDNVQLADFPTLTHIVQFVYDKRPELAAAPPVVAATVTPAPQPEPTAPVSTPAPDAQSSAVMETLLNLIAEKTGYPKDMLDPELDLEADLGIDTVKQAELFAEVREAYGIERDDTVELSAFPTLNHILQFVYDKRPDLVEEASAPPKVETPAAAPTAPVTPAPQLTEQTADGSGSPVMERILDLIAEKTGYPKDMLDPELDLEADLGIDTVKQAELFAEIREEYGIERDDTVELSEFPTLNHILGFVMDRKPELAGTGSTPASKVETTQPAQPSAPSGGGQVDEIMEKVLDLIAEKTGYPKDMLDPELDLEADLGIDTVKQAELFADIREQYGIERDDTVDLSEFPTLNHIVQFVMDRMPAGAGASVAAGDGPETPGAITIPEGTISGSSEEALKVPRRVPVAQLRPALEDCQATGASIREGGKYLLMSDEGGVGAALTKEIKKFKAELIVLDPVAERDELEKMLQESIAEQAVDGVFWFPSLDVVGALSDMTFDEWKAITHKHVKLLHATMRTIIRTQDEAPFLLSATRLGGRFGYDEKGAQSPMGGAVCGFTKSYKREHPESLVKVIDFAESRKKAALAKTILEELERDPGIVELGYHDDKRWTIGLEEQPWPETDEGIELHSDSVFLITGAAGSIVSAIIADLARKVGGGTFHLLDLAEEPDANDKDLQLFRKDKEGLKRELFTRMAAEGKKVTPVMIEKILAGLERKDAALQAIETIAATGGKTHYHSVNLLSSEDMAKVMKKIRKESKQIDVLMHAGGLEISQLLPNKSTSEFDLVFDVKADGWYNMMTSLGDYPIKRIMVFSSIAGRFGNAGQTDYSAANDFLCKSMSHLKSSSPETVGIALDWTAWDAIGMASRGSIPTIMKAAGIDMLPPEAGIGFLEKSLAACGETTEMVVAQSLGMMLEEFAPNGGVAVDELSKKLDPKKTGVMIQGVEEAGLYKGLVVSGTFNPKEQGFLFDHEINGTPVLPGVMGIEAMAEAVRSLHPDYRVEEVFDVEFLSPFKFYRSEPRKVYVKYYLSMEGEDIVGHCKLFGLRKLHGKEEEEVTDHFRGKVRLTKREVGEPENIDIKPRAKKSKVEAPGIYDLYFHGPAYQVLDGAWTQGGRLVSSMAKSLPANHSPESASILAMPRHIEACFQAAGLIEMGQHDRMGLPAAVGRVRFYGKPNPQARLFAVVDKLEEGYDVSIVDKNGAVYLTVGGYQTSALPGSIDEVKNKALKELF